MPTSETGGNEPGVIQHAVIVGGIVDQDHGQRDQGEGGQELARPLCLGGDGLDPAEQAEAGADHLGQTGQNLGQVTTGLLLDGHGHRQEAQILHVQTFGHLLEGFAHVAAIGAFIGDDAEFGRQRVFDSLATIWMAEENGCPTRKRAHHQFHGVRQLLFDQGHALFGLAVDPDIDRTTPIRIDAAARSGTSVWVPMLRPDKGNAGQAAMIMISCRGVKAMAAFCAFSASSE